MSELDCKINYKNFEPQSDEVKKIQSIASHLYFSSPSDSSLKISLEKLDHRYHCRIEINSASLKEKAFVSAENLLPCLENGSELISSKIDQWKKHRFKDLAG
jgi:hypothetical protein